MYTHIILRCLRANSTTWNFKLRVVSTAEAKSKEATAREFEVDSKRIHEWCSQKDKLLEMKNKGKSQTKRLQGGERKPLDESMEEELFGWIIDLRSHHLRVSRKMIREHAKTLKSMDGFKASKGWLQQFLR